MKKGSKSKARQAPASCIVCPSSFRQAVWDEIYYASGVLPFDSGDDRYRFLYQSGRGVRLSFDQIEQAISNITSKIESIQGGRLGPEEEEGGDKRWIQDLEDGIVQLLVYLSKKQETCRKCGSRKG